jgi:hypothetical protein
MDCQELPVAKRSDKLDINALVIRRIRENINDPVLWISQKLDVRKETAYRRLKGLIPFSLDEFSILSKELGFYIESFDDASDPENIQNISLYILKQYREYLGLLSRSDIRNCIQTSRRLIFLPYWIEMPSLLKLYCYKFSHRVLKPYSEIRGSYTDEFLKVRDDIAEIRSGLRFETECIIYKNLLASLIDDIQYFHLCKLISTEERESIRQETHLFLNKLEDLMTTGYDGAGHYTFYLSMIDVESDIICAGAPNNKFYSLQWSPENFSVRFRLEGNQNFKKWINIMKRYTSVITQSNEILRSDFFEKQRKMIDGIAGGRNLPE